LNPSSDDGDAGGVTVTLTFVSERYAKEAIVMFRSPWILPLVVVSLCGLTNFASAQSDRPYLGIFGEDPAPGSNETGAIVREVANEGPADKAGIKVGDRIVGLGDQEIKSFEDLRVRIGAYKAGDEVEIRYVRDKEEKTVTVDLTKPPVRPRRPERPEFPAQDPRLPFDGNDRGGLPANPPIPFPGMEEALKKALKPQPMIGVLLEQVDDELRERLKLGDRKGLIVADVIPDSPALKAGIKVDDLILSVDGRMLTEPEELPMIMKGKKKGDELTIKLLREGKEMETTVTVDERRIPFNIGALEGSLPLEGSSSRMDELEAKVRELEKRVDQLQKKLESLAPAEK
jgi:predicted metalloprotease with PDZ domain